MKAVHGIEAARVLKAALTAANAKSRRRHIFGTARPSRASHPVTVHRAPIQLWTDQKHTVLNRRNLESILRESKNESVVTSLQDLSSPVKNRIQQFEKADAVMFGDVFDDREVEK